MKKILNVLHHKLIIIGSGPAGYTAAIYSARANLNPMLITGLQKGGQLITTHKIENWPGSFEHTSGIDLMNRMEKHALQLNTNIIFDHVLKMKCHNNIFKIYCSENIYTCDALIIATGSSPRFLGLENEKKFLGKGVSTCATCDGFFFKEKDVAIVGGGNTAIEEALYLSNIVKKIYLIHRNQSFRAEQILIERLKKRIKEKKIIPYTEYIIKNIIGSEMGLSAIEIESNNHVHDFKKINISALFIAIGSIPNTKIFKNEIELENGYIKIVNKNKYHNTQTNVPGIFAAGDVVDYIYKQAITSAGSGCMAALDAERYLNNLYKNKKNNI